MSYQALKEFGHSAEDMDIAAQLPTKEPAILMTVPSQPGPAGVTVRCHGCGHQAVVTSRSELGIVEELHMVACDVTSLTTASTDDILSLRPYAVDLSDEPRPSLLEQLLA